MSSRGAFRYRLSRLAFFVFGGLRTSIGYVSFTASILTALTLLFRRDFISAGLTALEEFLGPVRQLVQLTRDIVDGWHFIVITPLQNIFLSIFGWMPPLFALEIGTLTLFAFGVAFRSFWTARAVRSSVAQRRERLNELRETNVLHAKALEDLKNAKATYEEAYKNRNWKRAGAAAGVLFGVGAVVAAVFTKGVSLSVLPAAQAMVKGGAQDWEAVKSQIENLSREISNQAAAQQRVQQRMEALATADNGFLDRISRLDDAAARAAINMLTRDKMRISIVMSRVTLGMLGAVIAAYGVEWSLGRL